MAEKPMAPLGTAENPWPAWAVLQKSDVEAVCAKAGKTEDDYYGGLLPALAGTVRRVEAILRSAADREDTREFVAENILRIADGTMYVKIFTCVNGHCHVPAEAPLAAGVNGYARTNGWHNVQFDFTAGS